MNPLSTEARKSVLDPTIPVDIGVLSQRQRIIDAMIESCAEKTYAATTIADIVRHASISRTTFYKRFAGKRECFDAALDFCIEELQTAAASACVDSDSPPEAVCKAATAALGMMAARPGLAQLVAAEAVSVEPAVNERYRKLLVPALEKLWDTSGDSQDLHVDARLAISRAQLLVYNQIMAGRSKELPELLPEILYLSLLPFVGHEEALEQAQAALRDAGADTPPDLGGG